MRPWISAAGVAVLAWTLLTGQAASLTDGPSVDFTHRSQAVIRWRTDVSTGTRVFFGPSATRLTRRAEGDPGLNHSVVLPALEPGTTWFFSVGTARLPLATNSFTVPGPMPAERSPPPTLEPASPSPPAAAARSAPPTRETWGYLPSLPDHFARHGRDFNARDADDYARLAWEFQQRAQREGLPTKVDAEGVKRVYDPQSGAFAAYNRNGTTKTFFKPNSRDYFDRQPGELVPSKNKP